ncbi:MAG: protein kinase [Gemmatimonadetes bacterium]|nr:protein kinase [Gemmatimonadota bacterium]
MSESSPPPDASNGDAPADAPKSPPLRKSGLGSGLLARQPTPQPEGAVAVRKMCPTCGREYETQSRYCPEDGSPLRPLNSGADPLIGTVVADRYLILKRIGEGGMGRVYFAEHVKMNRHCALKVMSAALVNDPESAARFAREASNAAKIMHANVAAVFDFGESDGLVYLVMEFVEGKPLSSVLDEEKRLPVKRALDLARQVADGLAAAHDCGIIHRDLKPDNIIVGNTKGGREVAKVVDFGIAKAVEDANTGSLTKTGLVIGTPEYMSPEQLLGDPLDGRTDVYSLGCILYQMLTGAASFQSPTREQMIKKRLSEEPPRIRSLVPELPESLDDVVAKMMARSPAERYTTASEVHEILMGRFEPGSAYQPRFRPTPRSAPTVTMEPASRDQLAHTTPLAMVAAPKPPSRRRVFVIGGLAALVAVAITAMVVSNYSSAAPTAPAAPVKAESVSAVAPAPLIVAPVDSAKRAADTTKHDSLKVASVLPRAVTPPVAVPAARDTATPASRAALTPLERRAERRAENRAEIDSVLEMPGVSKRPDAILIREALGRYARAIESEDLAKVRQAYPGLTPQQETFWAKNVFALADNIHAQVRPLRAAALGKAVQVGFSLHLRFVYHTSGSPGAIPLFYEGIFVKEGPDWILKEIRDRRP